MRQSYEHKAGYVLTISPYISKWRINGQCYKHASSGIFTVLNCYGIEWSHCVHKFCGCVSISPNVARVLQINIVHFKRCEITRICCELEKEKCEEKTSHLIPQSTENMILMEIKKDLKQTSSSLWRNFDQNFSHWVIWVTLYLCYLQDAHVWLNWGKSDQSDMHSFSSNISLI